ncbi:hypothetical protein [Streptomyces jumonjinensis]|uniref:hypothetical protein n=1 Tax=Streptomyces jumonjinensis TaxID=1945 RepID=UPI0012973287|nr:hypothetical protein [Streptomyces jumonjinensis]
MRGSIRDEAIDPGHGDRDVDGYPDDADDEDDEEGTGPLVEPSCGATPGPVG